MLIVAALIVWIVLFVENGSCLREEKEKGSSLGKQDFFLNAAKQYVNDQTGLVDLYSEYVETPANSQLTDILEGLVDYLEEIDEYENPSKPRHVLTILSDDQGYADIGYVDPTIISPTVDTLANLGIKFNSFYVQSTCSPTRASLLTGRDVGQTGLQDGAIIPGESRYLPYNLQTAGNYFTAADYDTYFIGKWHLGQRYLNQTPNARGYDYFYGILGGAVDSYTKKIGLVCGSADNNYTAVFSNNCLFLNAYDLQENGIIHVDTTTYLNDLLADKAVEKILSHDPTKPMLLHFHSNVPHAPLVIDAKLGKLNNLCSGVSTATDAYQPYYRQIICSMVTSLDIDILRMVFALALNDMLRNTLIVYHSDNGGLTIAGSNNVPYKSMKGAMYEGGIHVPGFIVGNGLRLASRLTPERDDLFFVTDILPTILSYAGIDVGQNRIFGSPFDGYSVWSHLRTGLPLPRKSVPVVSASQYLGYFTAYIDTVLGRRYKYVFDPTVLVFAAISSLDNTYTPEGEFLYDLTNDPYETISIKDNTDLQTVFVLNYLRARVLLLQATSVPSQVTSFPPVIDLPPNPYGCWLPLDSPYFDTAKCPVDETSKAGMFKIGERFMVPEVSTENKYNFYVTSDLTL